MSMRVLITGSRGQVGQELLRLAPAGCEAIGMGSNELDIADARLVNRVVAEVQPHLIINAAAYTAVDKAESEPKRAWAVNSEGVTHLARAAEGLGIPLFHISTDYVFAGDARAPYQENDPTGPSGVYGASKLAGEAALTANCRRHIILRTSWVFGIHGHNFVKTMLRLSREREELGVVADQYGCPTSAASIAQALWSLTSRYHSQGSLPWGIYHFSGTPACTWHEFAREIFRQAHELGLLDRTPSVRAIATADYPTPARRPAWSVLDCQRFMGTFEYPQSRWSEELHMMLSALLAAENS